MKPRVSQCELLDHIAGVERIDFERWHRPLERDVAARVRVEKDVTSQRIVKIDHGWQSLGLDHDGFSRIGCLRAGLREHDRYHLPDESHDIVRHHRADHCLVGHR